MLTVCLIAGLEFDLNGEMLIYIPFDLSGFTVAHVRFYMSHNIDLTLGMLKITDKLTYPIIMVLRINMGLHCTDISTIYGDTRTH